MLQFEFAFCRRRVGATTDYTPHPELNYTGTGMPLFLRSQHPVAEAMLKQSQPRRPKNRHLSPYERLLVNIMTDAGLQGGPKTHNEEALNRSMVYAAL